MHDLGFVRANLGLVEEKLRARGADPAALLKNFSEFDVFRRQAITEVETLKGRRNKISEQVSVLKRAGGDASDLIEQTRALKQEIDELDVKSAGSELAMQTILTAIPNLPAEDVPPGKSEHDNVEVRRWGAQPEFEFAPKPHWELGEKLGVLDFARAAKISPLPPPASRLVTNNAATWPNTQRFAVAFSCRR